MTPEFFTVNAELTIALHYVVQLILTDDGWKVICTAGAPQKLSDQEAQAVAGALGAWAAKTDSPLCQVTNARSVSNIGA